MNQPQPQQRTNQLLQHTKAAGAAVKDGDMDKLREAAQSLAKANIGELRSVSSTERVSPGPTPLVRPNNGNQGDNDRGIHQDRPLPGRGR